MGLLRPGFRHDSECQIQYPNGDRFFGQYVHGRANVPCETPLPY